MRPRSIKWHFIMVLLVLFAITIAPQAIFAANETTEALYPVGGWSPAKICIVEDDPEVDNATDLPTFKNNIINTEPDSVFTKGASTVGYDALTTDAQRNYYRALEEEAIAFMNAKEDLKTTEIETKNGSTEVYVVAQLLFEDYGIENYEEASQAYYAFDYDHPAYYWISNSVWSNDEKIYLSTEKEYSSVKERARINSLVDAGVKNYIAVAENGEDTLDKIAMIHDQILDDVDYAYQNDGITTLKDKWAHNVHGVFDPDHKKAVCEGYADAFALIMNYMGIPNYYIVGSEGLTGGGHAWNAVSANDGESFMYMDLTWDDLGEKGYCYENFGMPSSDFEKLHRKYVPQNTKNKWLYPINENFNNEFTGTYYSQSGLCYDDTGSEAGDFVAKGMTKAGRVGSHASFVVSSKKSTLFTALADVLRIRKNSYHTISYKGTDYYVMVTPISDNEVDLSAAELTLSQSSYTYTAGSIEPKPVVTCNGVSLIEGLNYTLSYSNNIKVSDNAVVTATGVGKFTGSASTNFAICSHNHVWTDTQFTWKPDLSTVTATHTCQLELCDVGTETETIETTSAVTKAPSCTEEGTRTFTAKFRNQAFGTQTKDAPIEALGHKWDKGVVTKEPTFTNVGVRTFTCKHDPTHTMTEEIPVLTPETFVMKGTTITRLLKGKKQMTVKWKKQSVQTTGYQIRYSLKKNFRSGVKTVTIKSVKTTKKVIKKLKAKKTYYVQIRTYKKIDGQNYYSAWSKTKSVKTK